jgi:hypothetical protein
LHPILDGILTPISLLVRRFRSFPPTRCDDADGNVVDGLAGAVGDV